METVRYQGPEAPRHRSRWDSKPRGTQSEHTERESALKIHKKRK